MSEARNSYGVIKPIIVGVATTVLTSVILFHLGLSPTENDQTRLNGNRGLATLSELNSTNIAEIETTSEGPVENYPEYMETRSPWVDISGYWIDLQTQASYQIQQQGSHFTFQEISYGSVSAEGQGNLQGNAARFSYATLVGTKGDGHFKIDASGRRITSSFTDHFTGITQTVILHRK